LYNVQNEKKQNTDANNKSWIFEQGAFFIYNQPIDLVYGQQAKQTGVGHSEDGCKGKKPLRSQQYMVQKPNR
jgi:hypothetical protein